MDREKLRQSVWESFIEKPMPTADEITDFALAQLADRDRQWEAAIEAAEIALLMQGVPNMPMEVVSRALAKIKEAMK